jgi:hypothetical protein
MAKTRKNKKNNITPLSRNNYTFIGLQHWFEETCDKLGWVVLGKGRGYDHKVDAYRNTLENIRDSVEHVIKDYQDPDRKHDLKVLHSHVCYLIEFVKKHL